jgi:hypothetical protein
MKKLLNFLFIFVWIVLIMSCTESSKENVNLNNQISTINVSIEQPSVDSSLANIINSRSTRSKITGSSLSFGLGFTKGDTIGIFPESGYQIAFDLDVPQGQVKTSTSISAKGWKTKENVLYSCYMPFVYDNKNYSHIPWNLEKIQVQRGNNNRDSMSNYAIYASDTVTTSDANFHTSLCYMGSMLAAVFNAPQTANFTRVIVASSKKIFATKGYYDLFDINSLKEPSSKISSCPYLHQPFHGENYSDHITLNLKDFSVNKGTQMWAWFIVPETVLVNTNLELYVWDSDGNCYTATKLITTDLKRNTISGYLFSNLTKTTTPYTNLNPWEEDKDTCSTCYPVAF